MASERSFPVVVVGSGPAGIAAACCAAESGQSVGIIDDNPGSGGQIWRQDSEKPPPKAAQKWLDRAQRSDISFVQGAQIVDHPKPGCLVADQQGKALIIRYQKVILATGARERFLPFPGWTLPGVMGAGGLQAIVKSGLNVTGKRVIVCGSGPLLLAVAAYLRKKGAIIPVVAEQAPRSKVLGFGLSLLWQSPKKLLQAITLRRGLTYRTDTWVSRAEQSSSGLNVTLTNGKRSWTEECDYLAYGYGLVPNLELPALLGCMIRRGAVAVDAFQCALSPDVYCAGEITGIGGLEKSLLEGQIAGYAAAGAIEQSRRLFSARRRAQRFADRLEATFALRKELKGLAEAETMVCRCEDVTYERVRKCESWREAKLQTRCGMGPCQGRICGAATDFLFGWGMESVRPPIFPTSVEIIATDPDKTSE